MTTTDDSMSSALPTPFSSSPTPALVVRPIRFTDDVPAMRAFLELIGLRPRVESTGGLWLDLLAGAGMVALHSAATSASGRYAGETSFSAEVADPHTLVARLRATGFDDAEVIDESYGHDVHVTDPLGDALVLNGVSDDLYGYRVNAPVAPDPRLRVSPHRFADPLGPYGPFLEALGLHAVGTRDEYFATYAVPSGGGVFLHHTGIEVPVSGPGAVQLGFTTTEPVDDLVNRLAAAGVQATVRRDEFVTMATVTDPDGQQVQISEA